MGNQAEIAEHNGTPAGRSNSAAIIRNYVNISKPRIIMLLDFVAISALLVAHYSTNPNAPLPVMLIGGVILAGSLASGGAAAINAYLDRDIDALMSRTESRPVPMGSIPPKHALYFGITAISIAFLTAVLFLNLTSTFMIMLGAFIYIFVYSLWLKRKTSWNIVIGGSAGSAAAFAGWTAVTPELSSILPAVLMGVLVFLWTPSHFWSLAIVNNRDYEKAGVPMLPVVVGETKAIRYLVLNTLLLIPFSLSFFFLGMQGILYLIVAASTGVLLLVTNIRMLRNPTSAAAWSAFKYSSPYLTFIFLGMVVDSALMF